MSESVKIHVSELRIGMYVSKLDRDWLDTPFIMQGFVIEDPEDVDIVAEYCEYVWIDSTYKSRGSKHSSNVPTATQVRRSGQYADPKNLEAEHRRAYKSFRHGRRVTFDLLDAVRLGDAIDGEAAKQTVSEVVTSVIRHPDAMLWLSKIREESSYTSDHCLNVCVLAVAFGRHLGIEKNELEELGLCGLLHDIGKMRVPDEILNKPGRLSEKEFNLMKAHTVHGRNLLLSAKNVYAGAIDVAYNHHERIDGNGYPRKLDAAKISRFTRIISIVDVYDAITAERCYSKARTSTEALKIIYAERGTQFDEALALEFIKTIGLYPPGSIVELHTGEVGFVIESNPQRRHLPKVLLVLDEDQTKREKEKIIDLSFIESGELPQKFLIKKDWSDGEFGLNIKRYKDKGLMLKY